MLKSSACVKIQLYEPWHMWKLHSWCSCLCSYWLYDQINNTQNKENKNKIANQIAANDYWTFIQMRKHSAFPVFRSALHSPLYLCLKCMLCSVSFCSSVVLSWQCEMQLIVYTRSWSPAAFLCEAFGKVQHWVEIVESENTNTNRDKSLGCDYPAH